MLCSKALPFLPFLYPNIVFERVKLHVLNVVWICKRTSLTLSCFQEINSNASVDGTLKRCLENNSSGKFKRLVNRYFLSGQQDLINVLVAKPSAINDFQGNKMLNDIIELFENQYSKKLLKYLSSWRHNHLQTYFGKF